MQYVSPYSMCVCALEGFCSVSYPFALRLSILLPARCLDRRTNFCFSRTPETTNRVAPQPFIPRSLSPSLPSFERCANGPRQKPPPRQVTGKLHNRVPECRDFKDCRPEPAQSFSRAHNTTSQVGTAMDGGHFRIEKQKSGISLKTITNREAIPARHGQMVPH